MAGQVHVLRTREVQMVLSSVHRPMLVSCVNSTVMSTNVHMKNSVPYHPRANIYLLLTFYGSVG